MNGFLATLITLLTIFLTAYHIKTVFLYEIPNKYPVAFQSATLFRKGSCKKNDFLSGRGTDTYTSPLP